MLMRIMYIMLNVPLRNGLARSGPLTQDVVVFSDIETP